MSVRNEDTLRRMWTEHLIRRDKAAEQAAIEQRATEDAETHERTAKTHRTTAAAVHTVGAGWAAESDDLADIVNEKRVELGLAPLTPGEPYPGEVTPAEQPTPEDMLVASAVSAVTTHRDPVWPVEQGGEVAQP